MLEFGEFSTLRFFIFLTGVIYFILDLVLCVLCTNCLSSMQIWWSCLFVSVFLYVNQLTKFWLHLVPGGVSHMFWGKFNFGLCHCTLHEDKIWIYKLHKSSSSCYENIGTWQNFYFMEVYNLCLYIFCYSKYLIKY
jgi:hypothetical protein